jgi:hypothetical protein
MCQISLAPGGNLALTIPSTTSERAYTVIIPLTLDGLRLIRDTLRQRTATTLIAQPGAPTQAMIEAWLQEERQQRALAKITAEKEAVDKTEAALARAGINIKDLGLNL